MKSNQDKISISFGETLVKSDLTNVSIELLESVLDDTLFEQGLLREIPIINTLIGLGKTANSIQNYLFTKKILGFLTELSKVSKEKRGKMISKIDSDPKYNQSVGSKLLFIIDNSQDHLSAIQISKLFVAFLEEKITYTEFCKAALIINKVDYYDLEIFLGMPSEKWGKNGSGGYGLEEVDNFLINAGLCSAETGPVTVEDQDDWKSSEKYIVRGGETIVHQTLIGRKIYEILSEKK